MTTEFRIFTPNRYKDKCGNTEEPGENLHIISIITNKFNFYYE